MSTMLTTPAQIETFQFLARMSRLAIEIRFGGKQSAFVHDACKATTAEFGFPPRRTKRATLQDMVTIVKDQNPGWEVPATIASVLGK